MGIAFDMSARVGGTLPGAQELGRGLMRGNRAELKLGYNAGAALSTVREAFEREGLALTREQEVTLGAYLIGFSDGMRDRRTPVPDVRAEVRRLLGVLDSTVVADAYRDGFNAGQDTDITKVYPAGEPSLDQPPEEIDGTRAGADMH